MICTQQTRCLTIRLTMKSQWIAFLQVGLLTVALFFQTETVTANICVDKGLKPLTHFCGKVVDSDGTPIPNATVSVHKGGIEVALKNTDASGEFTFDPLEIGKYEFHAGATGFAKVSFPFVISKPGAKCRQKVEIQLAVGGECSHVQLVKK